MSLWSDALTCDDRMQALGERRVQFKNNQITFSVCSQNTVICAHGNYLKEQCVGLRGLCWQKLNIKFITIFSLVYNHLKLRIVIFVCLEGALQWRGAPWPAQLGYYSRENCHIAALPPPI